MSVKSAASKALIVGALGMGLVANASALDVVSGQPDAQLRLETFNRLIDEGQIRVVIEQPGRTLQLNQFGQLDGGRGDFEKAFAKEFDKVGIVARSGVDFQ